METAIKLLQKDLLSAFGPIFLTSINNFDAYLKALNRPLALLLVLLLNNYCIIIKVRLIMISIKKQNLIN